MTDALWKRFYEQQFGVESANTVIKRMKQKKIVFKWRQLFEVLYLFLRILCFYCGEELERLAKNHIKHVLGVESSHDDRKILSTMCLLDKRSIL